MRKHNNSGIGCLVVFIIVAISALIVYQAGGNDKDKDSIPDEYDWIVGIWTCKTPYGIQTYSLGKNGSFSDNDGHEGTYSIDNGKILTHLNGTIGFVIEIDEQNQRIGLGEEYWMTKVYD